ncbi:hypothetical protein GE09DRAFT_330697 [Coniochaeta sp. 2T2.1]|nr:hypothetical protein GE09DRAFT_330697 [Coniochaeta sp. 2T2.1]
MEPGGKGDRKWKRVGGPYSHSAEASNHGVPLPLVSLYVGHTGVPVLTVRRLTPLAPWVGPRLTRRHRCLPTVTHTYILLIGDWEFIVPLSLSLKSTSRPGFVGWVSCVMCPPASSGTSDELTDGPGPGLDTLMLLHLTLFQSHDNGISSLSPRLERTPPNKTSIIFPLLCSEWPVKAPNRESMGWNTRTGPMMMINAYQHRSSPLYTHGALPGSG